MTRPRLKLVDSSASSGSAPNACAIGLVTGHVRTSNGPPPMKLVAVVEYNCCANDGARNPLLMEPRRDRKGVLEGRSVAVGVDRGGRRRVKKTNEKTKE